MKKFFNKIAKVVKDPSYVLYVIKIKKLMKKHGFTQKEIIDNDLLSVSEENLIYVLPKIKSTRKKVDKMFKKIEKKSGKTREEVNRCLDIINEKFSAEIGLTQYYRCGLYLKTDDEIKKIVEQIKRRDALVLNICEEQEKISEGELDDFDPEKIELLKELTDNLLDQDRVNKYFERYSISHDISKEKFRPIAVDIETCKLIFGASITEYLTFHLEDKTYKERSEFIYYREFKTLLSVLNPYSKENFTKDKYRCYELLESYFGRDARKYTSIDEIDDFLDFCNGKNDFVKKPFKKAQGKGIEKVMIPVKDSDKKKLLQKLLDENGDFLAEERIIQHEKLSALNPDTVNTVRVITAYDGKNKPYCHYAFMKIGREGSFVDNGGAGGILVSIDEKNGVFNSSGCDENGVIYEKHPDTGICLKGYQLPSWDKALELTNEASKEIDEYKYIGWDITLTKEGKWIIVEGNDRTGAIGQQGPANRGIRKDMLSTYRKLVG